MSIPIHPNPKGTPTVITIAAPSAVRQQLDATHLADLVSAFIEAKRPTVSPKSLTNYQIDLAPFQTWWHAQDTTVLDSAGFAAFVAWLRTDWRNSFGKPATPQVLWRITKRVRQVLDWGHATGYIPVSVSSMVPTLPESSRLKYFPDATEIQDLVLAASGDVRIRDASLVTMLAATGARRFELAEACIEDIEFVTPVTNLRSDDDHAGAVWLRKTKNDRDGFGPGRQVVFDGVAGLILKCYLRSVNRPRGPIYAMTDTNIRNIVHQLGIAADLPRMHPHAFRSAFVDHWSDANAAAGEMAMIALRLQIGHTLSQDVTNRYRDLRNPVKNLRRIRQFYTSPLMSLRWAWESWPVHLEVQNPG
jgi:integrase